MTSLCDRIIPLCPTEIPQSPAPYPILLRTPPSLAHRGRELMLCCLLGQGWGVGWGSGMASFSGCRTLTSRPFWFLEVFSPLRPKVHFRFWFMCSTSPVIVDFSSSQDGYTEPDRSRAGPWDVKLQDFSDVHLCPHNSAA